MTYAASRQLTLHRCALQGWSCLMAAIYFGHQEVVQFLLCNGADILDRDDEVAHELPWHHFLTMQNHWQIISGIKHLAVHAHILASS